MAQLWSIRNSRFSFSLENKDACSTFSQFNHSNTKEDNTKISVRNHIKGTVNAVVAICHGNHNPIKADITMESVKQLELAEGKECYAVIKATNVMFATKKIPNISARNQIEGTVVAVKEGAVNGHVTIEDESGVRISGSITNQAARLGSSAQALP